MDDREPLVRDLSRLIRGELTSGEAKRLATTEGFRTFSELCEQRLPEDLGRIRIGTRDLLTRIERHRGRGGADLYELWFWADELYNISFNHRMSYEPRREELITAALSALSVVVNADLFPNKQKASRCLEYIRGCLIRGQRLRLRNMFFRIFEDLETARLASRSSPDPAELEEAPDFLPQEGEEGGRLWSEVVLLDRPFRVGADVDEDYNWMIAFTVTARSLYEAEQREPYGGTCPDCGRPLTGEDAEEGEDVERPLSSPADAPEGAKHRRVRQRIRPTPREDGEEIDRAPALRRLVPNFDFGRYRPRYLYDGDGIAEIVLDAPEIGQAELRYAAKLYCLANRIRSATLDGEPLKSLLVFPGTRRRSSQSPR